MGLSSFLPNGMQPLVWTQKLRPTRLTKDKEPLRPVDIVLYYRLVISDPWRSKVSSYAWRVLVTEDVLGLCALVLTMLMSLAIVVWFSCSIAISLVKLRQKHRKLRYKALLRENQRLRSLLADTAKERRLKKVHRAEVIRRKRNANISRNVA